MTDDLRLPASLARRFEALMFDWDGTAVTDREADAGAVRDVVERLCAAGVDVAIVSGTHVGNVDGQLLARPSGPGRLLMALNRGSELFEVGIEGPRVVDRREATAEEDAALTRAAEETVARLAARARGADRLAAPEPAEDRLDPAPRMGRPAEGRDRPPARRGGAAAARRGDRQPRRRRRARDRHRARGRSRRPAGHERRQARRDRPHRQDRFRARRVRGALGRRDRTRAGAHRGRRVRARRRDARERLVHDRGRSPARCRVLGRRRAERCPRRCRAPRGRARVLPRAAARPAGPAIGDPERRRAARVVARVRAVRSRDRAVARGAAHDRRWDDRHQRRAAVLTPAAQPELVAAGVYTGEGPATDLLDGPRWASLARVLAREDELRRVLDLRTGLLAERVDGSSRLDAVRFSSLARPGTAVLRAGIDPPDTSDALAAPDGTVSSGADGDITWMATRGTGGSITAAAWQHRDEDRLDRIAAYVTSDGGAEPERATEALANARTLGFDSLLAEHRRAWSRRWEHGDVRIEGDPELQVGVRLALFHLMASVASRGEAAVGARGLTGHAYRGHVFWDADLFVLPFLAATEPAAARAMLEYRLRRLPAALAAARAEGRRGARFPWESAADGFDVTPRSGRDQSGHVLPIRTGEAEVHIVGDIAWAACCYVDWTGDEEFAGGPGHRILVETARYWASRIRVDGSDVAHIFGVIGPDEYHEPVDDNAFTNVLARWNLRRAAASVESVGDGAVDAGERATWLRLAGLLVDGFDPATGLYEEFAGFFALEPLLIRDIAPQRPITADLLLGPERVHRAQIVKQTDVLMLHHLLPDEVAPGTLATNLDYYEPRTAHGSSLSPGIHSALFARAGRTDDALVALQITIGIDVHDLTRTGAGGVHLGAMGSAWQALAYGFGGLRPKGDALVVDPRLPDSWSALELRVQFRGVPLCLRVEPDAIIVRSPKMVFLVVDGTRVVCPAGETRLPRSNRAGVS